MCAGIPIPLKLDKLHRIIFAMSCMIAFDHADFFAVVVRFAFAMCSSICFFPDTITKWWCEIRRVLRLFLDNLTRQAIHLYSCLSLWPPGSSLVPIFGYAYAILELRSCHVSYPLVPQSKPILSPHPSYNLCLVYRVCLASRRCWLVPFYILSPLSLLIGYLLGVCLCLWISDGEISIGYMLLKMIMTHLTTWW